MELARSQTQEETHLVEMTAAGDALSEADPYPMCTI